MSPTLYNGRTETNLLLLQLVAIVVASFLVGVVKGPTWATSTLAGGSAIWLPAALFLLFFRKKQMRVSASGIVWQLAMGEAAKIIITGFMLLIILGLFKAVFVPVILGYLLLLVVRILASVMIKTHS